MSYLRASRRVGIKEDETMTGKKRFPETLQTEKPSGNAGGRRKKKKRTVPVILGLGLLVVIMGVGYVYLQKWMHEIRPVTTNPTKDVCLITGPAGLEDPIFMNIQAGIEEAQDKYGLTTGVISAKTDTEREFNARIDEACHEYRVVICYGQDMADNLLVKAQVYPQTKFIFLEGTIYTEEGATSTLPNVLEVGFRVEEASYLAGYLAVKMSSRNCLGFIGGRDEPALRAYYGYYAGAMYADRSCEIRLGLPGGSPGRNRIRDLTTQLFQGGVLIILHSVGSESQTIAECARQENKQIIETGIPRENAGAEVLTTVVKKYDRVVADLLEHQSTLTYGERIYYGYKEGALDLLRPEKNVTDSLWKQVEDLRTRIVNAQVKIPGTKDEFDVAFLGK